MIYLLPPNQHFFRVTKGGQRWADVLSGQGAPYLSPTGNRYNVVLQEAAYVSDSLLVAVTEWAHYAARDWQVQIGNHHSVPVNGPLVSDFLLWKFTVSAPTYVIDVEALAASLAWPPHVLLNPGKAYGATQQLANIAVGRPIPGCAPPHPGLKVPAVRSRVGPGAMESNFVFFRIGTSPSGRPVGKWRLRIEFLDLGGNPVTTTTPRVDWSGPRFQLLPPPGGGLAGQAPPVGYPLAAWRPLVISHL